MVRFRSSVFFRTFTIVVFAALSLALGAVFVPAQEAKQASGAKPQAGARGGPEAKQPDKEGWISLFDGKSLGDWKVVAQEETPSSRFLRRRCFSDRRESGTSSCEWAEFSGLRRSSGFAASFL